MIKENKIALITGGNRGLGKNMVQKIAQNKVDVIFTYNSNELEATELKKEIEKIGVKAAYLQLNTGNIKSFDDFLIKFKEVLQSFNASSFDFLINNAATGFHSSIIDTTEEQFDEVINVNFKGMFFLTQKLLPLIREYGRVINISSGSTRFCIDGASVCAAAKGAVEVFSRYLAEELGNRKIGVNIVAPGAIVTGTGGEKDVTAIAKATALGRAGEPDDVGAVVACLLTKEFYWVNGQRIEVSGGTNL